MIRLINIDPQLNGLPIHPQKGHDRCPAPLYPKGREGLNIEVFMEKGDGKHFRRHHSSLTPSSMKSNFDHLYLILIPSNPPSCLPQAGTKGGEGDFYRAG
jgi:hypothetical protein